jgi:tetratricopeptide (TPR) repeat protein
MSGSRQARLLPALLLTLILLTGCAAAQNRQGNQLYAGQQYDQAMLSYQDAQAELPEQAELHYNIGNTLHRTGNYARAISETLQLRPDAPANLLTAAAYNLGNSLYRLEQYADAVEAYKQALRLKPDDLDAKVNLELALRKLQEEQEQEEQAQQQEQQDQEDQPGQTTPTPQAGQQGGASTPTPQAGGPTPGATPTTPSAQPNAQDAGTPTPQAVPTGAAQAGMTMQQALQLLQALAEDEQTLQEILAQMERFPDVNVDEDW